MKKIKDLPTHERPREKLLEKGAETLSDQELLSIILGKGSRKNDVQSKTHTSQENWNNSQEILLTLQQNHHTSQEKKNNSQSKSHTSQAIWNNSQEI